MYTFFGKKRAYFLGFFTVKSIFFFKRKQELRLQMGGYKLLLFYQLLPWNATFWEVLRLLNFRKTADFVFLWKVCYNSFCSLANHKIFQEAGMMCSNKFESICYVGGPTTTFQSVSCSLEVTTVQYNFLLCLTEVAFSGGCILVK